MQGWQRVWELLLGWGHAQGVTVWQDLGDGSVWFTGSCLSVYFPHFGNQLITDLCEFLDLLVLWQNSNGRINTFNTSPYKTQRKKEEMRMSVTFWCRACSRESFFICSFLRLAVSAMLSELAFVRTWAISSLALRETWKGRNQERF